MKHALMHTKADTCPVSQPPTEAEIRACAHELYVRSGWIPGRDEENRREAEAWLSTHPGIAGSGHELPRPKRDRHSPLPSYR